MAEFCTCTAITLTQDTSMKAAHQLIGKLNSVGYAALHSCQLDRGPIGVSCSEKSRGVFAIRSRAYFFLVILFILSMKAAQYIKQPNYTESILKSNSNYTYRIPSHG